MFLPNLKLGYVRVDVAKVGFRTLHIGFEKGLCQEERRGDLQNLTLTLK